MMQKIITMTHYNRPNYTKLCMDYLSKCYGIEDYTVFINIDRDANTGRINKKVLDTIISYDNRIKIELLSFDDKNLGCNTSIHKTMDFGFKYTDYLIHIEDDIILSKDALKYFEWANETFKYDNDIFSIDGYNNIEYNNADDIEYRVISTESYRCWGWATWKRIWNEISPQWQFGYGRRKNLAGEIIFDGGSWDVYLKKVARKNRRRVFPKIPRTKNIGAYGVHTPSPEWHAHKHTVKVWADDFEIKLDKNKKINMIYEK